MQRADTVTMFIVDMAEGRDHETRATSNRKTDLDGDPRKKKLKNSETRNPHPIGRDMHIDGGTGSPAASRIELAQGGVHTYLHPNY
jgi:hypothetical protein